MTAPRPTADPQFRTTGRQVSLNPHYVSSYAYYRYRDKIVEEVFAGRKLVCLAITEAFAGSDVAGLKCTATKSTDGKFWTVNVCI